MNNDQDRSATAGADFTIDDDYQSELVAGSRSARAAHAGEAASAGAGASPQALHPIQLDGDYARDRSERFRAGARGYQRNHRTTSTAPYQEMTAQADAYLMDAANLGRAHVSYDGFLPLGQQSLQSILRFQSIQASLGPAFDLDLKDETALDTPMTGTDKGLHDAARAAGLRTSHGMVDIAARNLTASRHELVGVIQDLEVAAVHDIVVGLRARIAEHEQERGAIEAKIARVGSIAGGIEKALGYAHGAVGKLSVDNKPKEKSEDVVEDPNGADAAAERVDQAKEASGTLGEVATTVMEIFYDKQLNEIAVQITSLEHEIEGQEMVAEQAAIRSLKERFAGARTRYAADVEAYEAAIANRRTQYAQAGAMADAASAPGKGKTHDKAAQAMLFISAGREARVVLDTAIAAGQDASQDASTAIAGMVHRSGSYQLDDWTKREGEGDRGPDQLAVEQAGGTVRRWMDHAEGEQRRLDRVEVIARSALDVFGGVKGAY